MNALEFLKKPQVRPILAVSGDDVYLRREVIHAITLAALGPDAEFSEVSRFAGDQTKLADVLDEVRTLAFLAACRVALVEEADPFVTRYRKELEHYAEKPAASGVLILSVKSWPSNTKLAKLVEKTGLAVDGKTPGERELPAWVVGLAKLRHGVKLEDEASRLLVELVGPEPGLLASEVEKLAIYVGERREIRRQDVSKMVHAGAGGDDLEDAGGGHDRQVGRGFDGPGPSADGGGASGSVAGGVHLVVVKSPPRGPVAQTQAEPDRRLQGGRDLFVRDRDHGQAACSPGADPGGPASGLALAGGPGSERGVEPGASGGPGAITGQAGPNPGGLRRAARRLAG